MEKKFNLSKSQINILLSILSITYSLMLVVGNAFIAHNHGGPAILFTVVLLPVISVIVVFGAYNMPSILSSLLLALLITINDLGIKFYTGGSHDAMGQMIIGSTMFIGLIPSYIILIIVVFIKKTNEKLIYKFIAVIIFPLLMWWEIYAFGSVSLFERFNNTPYYIKKIVLFLDHILNL